MLLFVTYAARPLSIAELNAALSIEPSGGCKSTEDTRNFDSSLSATTIREAAETLLTVNEPTEGQGTQEVSLIHQSLKYYLLKGDCRPFETVFPNPKLLLGQVCCTYLTFSDFADVVPRLLRFEYRGGSIFNEKAGDGFENGRRPIGQKHQILAYASSFWHKHIKTVSDSLSVELSALFWTGIKAIPRRGSMLPSLFNQITMAT